MSTMKGYLYKEGSNEYSVIFYTPVTLMTVLIRYKPQRQIKSFLLKIFHTLSDLIGPKKGLRRRKNSNLDSRITLPQYPIFTITLTL